MAFLNDAQIIGNVGMKPELRKTPGGKIVTNFKVFVNRVYKEKGEPKNDTQTFSIVAFDKLAESCAQCLEQGKRIYVRGPVSLKTWKSIDNQFRAGVVRTMADVPMVSVRVRSARPKAKERSCGTDCVG